MKRSYALFIVSLLLFGLVFTPKLATGGEAPPMVLLDALPVLFPEEPYIREGTTMVPLRAIAESLGVKVQWKAQTQEAFCQKGSSEIVLQMGSSMVRVNNKVLTLPLKVERLNDTMMVPLRVFSETMGFLVFWDGPTRTVYIDSPKTPMSLWGFYALGSSSYSSWQDLFGNKYPFVSENPPASFMEGIFLGWYAIKEDATVTSSYNPSGFMKPDGWPAVLLQARAKGLKCYSMYFSSNQGGILSALLKDPVQREKLALSIAASEGEYDGILLDLEGLGASPDTQAEDAANLNHFVDRLKELLGTKPLALALPPLNSVYQGYDHEYLGKVADIIVVMAYDYQEPARPSPVAPWNKIEEAMRLETSSVPKEKILLAIPSYGVIYEESGDVWKIASKPPAKDVIAEEPKPSLDAPSQNEGESPLSRFSASTPFYFKFGLGEKLLSLLFEPSLSCEYAQYEEVQSKYQVFLESQRSLQSKVNLAKRYGIRGVALWRLGLLPEGFFHKALDTVEPMRQVK